MRYVHRELEQEVTRAAKSFPPVVLTGRRGAGKTWQLQHLLPQARYFLMEDPAVVGRCSRFIASEILKAQVHRGLRPELYYCRDGQGLEVDFLVPGRSGAVRLVQRKASRTVTPAMAGPMRRPANSLRGIIGPQSERSPRRRRRIQCRRGQ